MGTLEDQKVVVVGTAGHVDHGKSSLVRALTGSDPDRLAEEKARGLTIELGFAWCELPKGRLLSLVDVPGHEDFIRNMLAGAGAMDAVLLVIAADEGPMPQTREHLAILDLVGVHDCIVVITKSDLVEPDWLELVEEEARELIADTGLADAPVISVSSKSGAGLDELRESIEQMLEAVPPASDRGRPRLSIDRAFSIDGFGTVATGTLRDGYLGVGDNVELLPGGQSLRIRGIQSYGQAVEQASPGTRTAINLVGIDADAVARGAVLCAPDLYRSTRIIDAQLRLSKDAPMALTHDFPVKLFHGASELLGFLRLIGIRELLPGETAFVQIRLDEPAVLTTGDRFVLRLPSPSITVGGGRVLDAHPPGRRKRFAPDVLERFQALASDDIPAVALQMLKAQEPAHLEDLKPQETGLEASVMQDALSQLEAAGSVRKVEDFWLSQTFWDDFRSRAEVVLSTFHQAHMLRAGMPLEQFREQLKLSSEVYGPILAHAQNEGWLQRSQGLVHLAGHQVSFDEEQSAAIDLLLERFRSDPYKTPSYAEASEDIGDDLLQALIARGDLVQASAEVLFEAQGWKSLTEGILEAIDEAGQISVADLRDRFGTSRKYALATLEYMDRLRLTKRVGDARVRMHTGPASS